MSIEGEVTVIELAEDWLRVDKNPETRGQIRRLLDSNDHAALELLLRDRIAFGTAGLRARMEAGFSRINSVTVTQASQGLASYLLTTIGEETARSRGVVIGRDGRHNSEIFAQHTAVAFINQGIKAYWYEEPVHTPLVPFGVKHFGAAAGVMITASHNPPQDNGYKVYWDNGAQIIPPHDVGIAKAIDHNLDIHDSNWDLGLAERSDLVVKALNLVQDEYFAAIGQAIGCNDANWQSDNHFSHTGNQARFVYTAMHGVGLGYMTSALKLLGPTTLMETVPEQAHPDPNFPTVKFPNPEEKGALNLSIRTANTHNLPLIVANDPDADRLAIAQKVENSWHQFTGNQLGILLASCVLEDYKTTSSNGDISKLAMLSSTVSSRMLSTMATTEGFHHQETLTGFKWMGNVAYDLNAQGYNTKFAFEEAIGYMIPSVSHDKDGVAAAVLFLKHFAKWLSDPITHATLSPMNKLQDLYKKYGSFSDANTYLISPSPAVTTKIFNHIRTLGTTDPVQISAWESSISKGDIPAAARGRWPIKLGSRAITYWRDLTLGYESSSPGPEFEPLLPVDPTSQMFTGEMSNGVRFTVRASGTEPKIKFYVEGRGEDSESAKVAARSCLQNLMEEWFGDEEWGLKKP